MLSVLFSPNSVLAPNRAMLNAPPPQTTPQENKQKLAYFEQSPATKTGYSVTGRITLFQKLPTRLRY